MNHRHWTAVCQKAKSLSVLKEMVKDYIRDRLRHLFDNVTVTLEASHRDGLRTLAKLMLQNRMLVGGMLAANLGAALFEGGTIGVLAVAVNILVDGDAEGIASRLGFLGRFIGSLTEDFGRGGVFLILVMSAVLAQILRSALTYLGQYFSIRLQTRVSKELQKRVTHQIMSFSYSEIGRHPAGTMSTMIRQSAKYAVLVMTVNSAILTLFMFLVYVGLMIVMSVPLTLAALVVIGLLGVSLNGVVRALRSLGERIVSASVATGRVTFEYLQAPRLLRIFNATQYAENAINRARSDMISAQQSSEIIKSAVSPATDAVTIAGAGLFLSIGYLVAGEAATSVIPKLMLFVLVLYRLMPQVKRFNQSRMAFVNALPAVKRVSDFMREEDKKFSRTNGSRYTGFEKEVYFDKVGFRYPDTEKNALSDICFSIKKGQTVALVGPSGAGKSTIADLFLGLQEPTSGRILVDEKDLRDLHPGDWLNRIGVVDQEVFLMNTTIRDNIAFANRRASLDEIIEAAKAAYAHEFISALPSGYETEIGDRGYRLSGGQQQRLALARALLRNPEVLVLDEATSALDTETERIVQRTLENLHNVRTVLVIAHRLSTLAHADHIVVLKHGQVVEQGTWSDLLENPGTFADLWNMQKVYSESPK